MEKTLGSLPLSLHDTYQRILDRVDCDEESAIRARHVFECIASAKRPLTLGEVVQIFNVDPDSEMVTPGIDSAQLISDAEANEEDLESL